MSKTVELARHLETLHINDRYKNCNFEYQGWVK